MAEFRFSRLTRRVAVPLALAAWLVPGLDAQVPDLFRLNLTRDQGLIGDGVMAIIQDHAGYMWFGTSFGLDRWDGRSHLQFRTDPRDPNSISSNDVRTLLEDGAGRIWAGTGTGGLSVLEADRATWRRFRHDPKDPYSLGGDQVLALLQDHAGNVWAGAWGGGLNLYQPGPNRFLRFRHDPANPNSLCSDDVAALAEDGRGRIWVGTGGGGLSCFDRERNRWTTFRQDPADPDRLSDNAVTELTLDRRGRLWIGTWGKGIDRIDLRTGRWSHFRPGLAGENALVGGVVFSIHEDARGRIWVGTGAQGLNRYEPDSGRWGFTPAPSPRAFNWIECVTSDRGGVLWIGSMPGGLFRYPLDWERWAENGANRVVAPELREVQFSAVRQDRGGDCWLTAFPAQALYRYDSRARSWTCMRRSPANPGSTFRYFSGTTAEDREGGVWVGVPGGLERYDPVSRRWSGRRFPGARPDLYTVRVLADRRDRIWAGTSGAGLFCLEWKTGGWRRIGCYDGLCDDRIRALFQDRRGDIWVGSEHGVSRLPASGGPIASYFTVPGDPRSLSNDNVSGICQDRDGDVWVSTNEGLNRFVPETGNWRRYTESDGLPESTIFHMVADDLGGLWLNCRSRLARFDTHRGSFRVFSADDGLPPGPMYLSRTESGRILWACLGGFASFNPARIGAATRPPPLAIGSFRVGASVRAMGTGRSFPNRIVLSPDQNSFSFEFAALDFSCPERNRYAYRLEGYDPDWIEAGNRNYAGYSRVPPGSYTFRVIGAGGEGVWNRRGVSLAVVVERPFWMTVWFRLLALAGFAWLSHLLILTVRRHLSALAFWKRRHLVGPYRIVRLLGSGGMATVYLAENRLDRKRPVALKLMREEYALDPLRQKRFRQEGAIIDQLDHPHIVRIIERGVHDNRLFIAMEYLPGVTLADRLKAVGALEPAPALALLAQLADVLVKIHAHGVIHRDLKPANLMLVPDPDGGESIKVLDFGVARAQFQTTVTESGGLLGTIHYMAPEQITRSEYTPAGDIYSWGLIGYEMLGGRHPYAGAEPLEAIRLVLAAEAPPLAAVRPDLPPAVADLVMRAMSRQPESRPDAAALLAEIQRLRPE